MIDDWWCRVFFGFPSAHVTLPHTYVLGLRTTNAGVLWRRSSPTTHMYLPYHALSDLVVW